MVEAGAVLNGDAVDPTRKLPVTDGVVYSFRIQSQGRPFREVIGLRELLSLQHVQYVALVLYQTAPPNGCFEGTIVNLRLRMNVTWLLHGRQPALLGLSRTYFRPWLF